MAHTKKGGSENPSPAELCHADADDVTRHSFRGPVTETDHIIATIAGQRHAVADIGSHGIGILLAEGTALIPGQTHDFTLTLGNETLRLQGVVRHVTKNDEANAFHCGIQLLNPDHETERQLQKFILYQRQHLFTKPPA